MSKSTLLLATVLALPSLSAQIMVGFADPVESTGQASGTDGSTTVNISVTPNGADATLNGNATGVGVDSSEDSGGTTVQRRVDGTLATPESLTLTLSGFTGTLQLLSADLGSFRAGDTVTFQSTVFNGATGYDGGFWSFDDGTDTLSNTDTLTTGVQTITFGGSPLLFSAGDTVTFSTSTAVGGGVLLNTLVFGEAPASGEVIITEVPGLPGDAPLGNPGPSSGTTVVAISNSKGQTFSVPFGGTADAVVFQLAPGGAGPDLSGIVTLSIFETSDGVPTGTPLFSDSGELPADLVAGDYLQFALPSPLDLSAGTYAVTLQTTDTDLRFALTNTSAFAEGELIRNNSGSGFAWGPGSTAGIDFLFAMVGTLEAYVIDSPDSWPTTILENGPATGGGLTLSAGTQVGQSFETNGITTINTALLQLHDSIPPVDAEGTVRVDLFAADETGLPTGEALASIEGELPASLVPGDLLELAFPGSPVVGIGSYVLSVSTTDTELVLNTSSGNLFEDGELLSDTGSGWETVAAADQDLTFGVTGSVEVRPAPSAGPNIIVILADDFGWTDIQSGQSNLGNGSDLYQTPHLNRLASEGLSFTYAFVQPNCAPTRAALLSGQYSCRSGNGVYAVTSLNRGNGSPPLTPPSQREDVPAGHYNMAEMLYDAGYATCHVGKYHVGGKNGGSSTLPLNQGFDVNYGGDDSGNPGSFFANASGVFQSPSSSIDIFGAPYNAAYTTDILGPYENGNSAGSLNGSNKHLTDAEGDAVLRFMDDHRSGPLSTYPFYIQYHAYAVHTPVQPRPDLQAKYNGLPTGSRHTNRNYAGLVEGLDQSVGRILDYLDSTGLADNTLVVFLSDNGGHEGPTDNVPLRSRKGSFYNGGLRIPLIMRQPGKIPAGKISDALFHAVDLYPTLMEVSGGSSPEILDGFSIYGHACDPVDTPHLREPIFYHFPGYLDNRARPCSVVIKDFGGARYKLIYNYDFTYDPNSNDDAIRVLSQPWELYNITTDISESTNLVDGDYWDWLLYGAIADELAADLNAWLTQSDPTWNAKQVRSGGTPVPYPPVAVPDAEFEFDDTFRVLQVTVDPGLETAQLTFTSRVGLTFEIEATSTPDDPDSWSSLRSGIEGQPGSTDVTVDDPAIGEEDLRVYRVLVREG